jgi:hypothetical protein
MYNLDIWQPKPTTAEIDQSVDTIPIQDWVRKMYTLLPTHSLSSRSLENLLMIRPTGVVSKKAMGDLMTEWRAELWRLAAPRIRQMARPIPCTNAAVATPVKKPNSFRPIGALFVNVNYSKIVFTEMGVNWEFPIYSAPKNRFRR